VLTIYIVSILIWAIVIFICTEIFMAKIIENGWDVYTPPTPYRQIRRSANILITSAIPVYRLLIFGLILFAAFTPESDFNNRE
jgi:hypothetical protein